MYSFACVYLLKIFWPVHALITHRWSQKLSCHNWLRLQNFQFTELCLVFCISELEDNLQSPYDWISPSATKMCTKLHYRGFWNYKIWHSKEQNFLVPYFSFNIWGSCTLRTWGPQLCVLFKTHVKRFLPQTPNTNQTLHTYQTTNTHQTQIHTRYQTPNTHQTPNTRHQTPNTHQTLNTHQTPTKHTPDTKHTPINTHT